MLVYEFGGKFLTKEMGGFKHVILFKLYVLDHSGMGNISEVSLNGVINFGSLL